MNIVTGVLLACFAGVMVAFIVTLRVTTVYLLWAVVLIFYVVWPFGLGDSDRIGLNIPLEYVPLLTLLLCGWLSGLFRGRHLLGEIPRQLIIFGTGIIVYAVTSVFWAADQDAWLQYAGMWVTYLLLFFTIVSNLVAEPPYRLMQFLERFIMLLAMYMVAILVRYWAYPSDQYSWSPHLDFTPIIRYRVVEVWTVLPFIPVAGVLYLGTRRFRYLVVAVMGTVIVLLSLSRTGMVGLAATLGLLGWSTRDYYKSQSRWREGIVLLAIAIATAGMLGVAFMDEQVAVDRIRSISVIKAVWFSDPGMRDEGGGRRALIVEAIRIFSERPWLGTGVGNYTQYFDQSLPFIPMNPHNFYLSYLGEFGIIGFIPLLGFVLCITHLLWSSARRVAETRQKLVVLGFAAGHTALLVMFLATDFLIAPHLWFSWGLAVSCALSFTSRESVRRRGNSIVGRAWPRVGQTPGEMLR